MLRTKGYVCVIVERVHGRSGLLLKGFPHCKLPEAVSFDLRCKQSFEELTNDIYWKNRTFYC